MPSISSDDEAMFAEEESESTEADLDRPQNNPAGKWDFLAEDQRTVSGATGGSDNKLGVGREEDASMAMDDEHYIDWLLL